MLFDGFPKQQGALNPGLQAQKSSESVAVSLLSEQIPQHRKVSSLDPEKQPEVYIANIYALRSTEP